MNSDGRRSLLYIEAGWDLLLLENVVEEWGYDVLVCVDSLPIRDLDDPLYWCPANRRAPTTAALFDCVRKRLMHLGCIVEEEDDLDHNLHIFRCSGALNATVEYFYSTNETEMSNNEALAKRLREVRGLIVKGHQPNESTLHPDVLPNVRDLFLSERTHCASLPSAKKAIPDRLADRNYDLLSDDEEEGYAYDPNFLYAGFYQWDDSGSDFYSDDDMDDEDDDLMWNHPETPTKHYDASRRRSTLLD
jgi:hypothetical protein